MSGFWLPSVVMRTPSSPSSRPPKSPGSDGERDLQDRLGTTDRAQRFYDEQVLDHLNVAMRDFVRRQRLMFVATADASGECDSTLRSGPAGFVEVIDEQTLAWPEFRGNGVMASLGNIGENPHVGLLLVDFEQDTVGLHINGRARLVGEAGMRKAGFAAPASPSGRAVSVWVEVSVQEAYIHCSKHIPRLVHAETAQAPPPRRAKTADYFGAAACASGRADVEAAS